MIPLFRSVFIAFFNDPLSFKRWMRTAMASLAMVLLSVLNFAGTDYQMAIAGVKTWTVGDWAARIALGFLFSSVHGTKPAAEEPAAVKGEAVKGAAA